MLTFNIVTLFPHLYKSYQEIRPLKTALEKHLVELNIIDLREFSDHKRKNVDDRPYGGGVGMILSIDPLYRALHSIYNKDNYKNIIADKKLHKISGKNIFVLSPSGQRYTQKHALQNKGYKEITLVCGRYEGIDHRITKIADVKLLSIGDFILSGGELASLAIVESITRLIPGAIEKHISTIDESFADGTLEYPQYTRPESFKGLKVPDTLLSGHHKKIQEWRRENSKPISNF